MVWAIHTTTRGVLKVSCTCSWTDQYCPYTEKKKSLKGILASYKVFAMKLKHLTGSKLI